MGAVLAIGALLALGIYLSGPATVDTVVVLPSADGHTGTVVVQRGGERQVLDQPYASSRTGPGAAAEVSRLSAAEVSQSFGQVLEALPARPTAFLLYFITGSDELTEESKLEVQKVLAELKGRKVPDVLVIGHTDTVGDMEWNDRLSAQRAERMKAVLIEAGIPAERIRTAGRGKRELLVRTADNVEEPRNRRVEINVR
jgi:outer membrane protein OmpA-like peptidoglycan-associated protein